MDKMFKVASLFLFDVSIDVRKKKKKEEGGDGKKRRGAIETDLFQKPQTTADQVNLRYSIEK